MPINPYEHAARTRKAYALASAIHAERITADQAEGDLDKIVWGVAAQKCGVKMPSAETQKMAIAALREMEKANG